MMPLWMILSNVRSGIDQFKIEMTCIDSSCHLVVLFRLNKIVSIALFRCIVLFLYWHSVSQSVRHITQRGAYQPNTRTIRIYFDWGNSINSIWHTSVSWDRKTNVSKVVINASPCHFLIELRPRIKSLSVRNDDELAGDFITPKYCFVITSYDSTNEYTDGWMNQSVCIFYWHHVEI